MSDLTEAAKLIKNASSGVVFTGAGISVESGIAPFTGAGGLWNQYDPQYIGDFLVNQKYLFEVGGEGKSFDQIADIPGSYLAIDGIETGYEARVPLWMFGLLY